MLVIVVILLLVSSLVTGLYFTMNKSTPVQTSPISPESKLDLKVPPTSPVVKPPLQAMIPKSRYPKAKTIKVGKTDLISNWNNRYINLMEVYVYGKDGKNIALKKPIASNTPNYKDWVSKFNDGDEMTLGHTGGHKEDDTQPQRQSFEIDLGSMQEIHSVVIVDRLGRSPGRLDKLKVMLLDDDLQMVTKTSNLSEAQAKKGTKHRYDFGTKKWTLEPVDCVGKWGPWSKCSAGCSEDGKQPDGSQKRDWITLRKAENGGKACVYDVNKDGFKVCKGSTGSWTGWSGCSRRCGTGSSTRKFIVKTKGDGDGSTCPGGANGKTESKRCNTHGCPPRFTHPGYNLCGGWWDVMNPGRSEAFCDDVCWRDHRCKAYMQANYEHSYRCRLYDNSRHCGNRPWDWHGARVRNPNYYAP